MKNSIKNYITPEKLIKKLKQINWFNDIIEKLKNQNKSFYFVGGTLRDAIISIIFKTRFTPQDIDLVVELNNYEELLQLVNFFSFNKKVQIIKYPQFLTLSVIFYNKNNKRIDFALPRKEEYRNWGVLPQVAVGNIDEDLFRRDFSINSIALRYDSFKRRFEILDPFGGINDIFNKKIRVLHKKSFFDDPTRIIRGIRLLAKLNFYFEENTLSLLKEALEKKVFSYISKTRLTNEFVNILKKGKNLDIVAFLFKEFNLIEVYSFIKEIISCFIRNCKKIELDKINCEDTRYYIRLFYLLEALSSQEEKSLSEKDKIVKFKKYLIELNIPRQIREKIYKAVDIFSGKRKDAELEEWMKLYVDIYKKKDITSF
ncbi:MAG: hypothetical protein N2505_02215 [Endomicrobia bacterium]|nr:hypothetical protein [Endomicrobiia bacterium]